uniref:uncharacterized protein cd34 isoform X2 n=1 Tax=Pristiophorus japonicus TaxID=55135 RepID=UPI00398E8CA7
MSVMWSLVNISKGQQFSLMLCALCLIVQWSCHCSAEDPVHSINLGAQSDVTSTIENKLNTSIAIATAAPGDSNTSALRSAENSSDQIRIDVTTLQSTQNMLNHGDIILTTLSSTTDYKFIERGTNSNLGMQGDSKPSKADQPVVLISLLTCGLIVAAMILAAYYRMHKRSWTPQSKRLRTNQMHMRSQN